jgi:divalent metal cation (Fe/Co/Zn/Cd) transporter
MDEKRKRIAVGAASIAVGVVANCVATLNSNALVLKLDLVGGLLELGALAITWQALARAGRPANEAFNYGLGKLENLCGLLIAQVQFASLLVFLWIAVDRILHPVPLRGAAWGLVIYGCASVGTFAMMRWSQSLATSAPSPVSTALWRGYQVKFAASLGTALVMLVATLFPDRRIAEFLDPLNVTVLCALRIRNILLVVRAAGRDLLDAAVGEEAKIAIFRALIANAAHWDDVLRLETRQSPGTLFVTVHLAFDEARSLPEMFASIEVLRQAVVALLPTAQVTVVPHPLVLK